MEYDVALLRDVFDLFWFADKTVEIGWLMDLGPYRYRRE
jgi:hypothetical protein